MIEERTFQPHPLLANAHVQSIGGHWLKRRKGIQLRRERIELPDGDFLDIDYAEVPGRAWSSFLPDAPIALMLHGLEGSSGSGYMWELYRQMAARGIRPIGINYRFCSGEVNRTQRLYHSGATGDVAVVLAHLRQKFPNAPLMAVGISLGANLLLKLLGEQGEQTLLQRAAAISPPFQLDVGLSVFDEGSGRIYAQNLLRSLKAKVRRKAEADGFPPFIEVERILNVTKVGEFDDLLTAKLHGFRDKEDYYQHCSCAQYLPHIRIPTLVMRSTDDPFFDASEIPHQTFEQHPFLKLILTEYGGHCGFIARHGFWAEETAANFVAERSV
jgi:predicted alpha/beta-fold hydrolase